MDDTTEKPVSVESPLPSRRLPVVLASAGCATGGALVIHILTKVSLALAAAVLLLSAIVCFAVIVRRLDDDRRQAVLTRLQAGALAGLLATLAYDAARYGTVALFELSFKPFHAFQFFGRGLAGEGISTATAYGVGALFHFANGIGFGIAFALFVRRPRIWKGILWAMLLELTMVAFYPSWLQIQALGEFLEISVLGHAVYGAVLGALTKRWVEPA